MQARSKRESAAAKIRDCIFLTTALALAGGVSHAEAPPAGAARTESAAGISTSQVFQLERIGGKALHASLEELVQRALPVTHVRIRAGDLLRFELPPVSGQGVVIQVNLSSGQTVVKGTPAAVHSWLQVLRAIDEGPSGNGGITRLIAIRRSSPEAVRKVLQAVRRETSGTARTISAANGAPHETTAEPPVAELLAAASENRESATTPPGDKSPPSGSANDGPARQQLANRHGPADAGDLAATGGTLGPVDIQFLEGSNVIVLRGHERDVARVRKLIARIEQLSVETEPEVVVHPLLHTGSQAMAAVLEQLYAQIYEPRQGTASIVPLAAPNALLLAGRSENVATLVRLLSQLDKPVDAAAQFRVFRLRHASAVEAKTTIDAFLERQDEEPAALATRAQVIADFRSNSLIVQAGPRDLAEIESLVQRLDTATAEAVNEVKIFQLENARAEDIARLMREAIAMGQTAPGVPAGGSRGPGNALAAAGEQRQKSTALRFLTLDGNVHKRLRSGILTDVRITADSRVNSIVVSAPADSMELLGALVQALDQVPTANALVKVFTIVNGDAVSLVDTLQRLFEQENDAAVQQQFGGAAAVSGLKASLRLSVDERTNSVIASGDVDDLRVVEAILLRLDDTNIRLRKTAVYRLKNSPAEDVADAVNRFLRKDRDVNENAPGAISPFREIEREVILEPEVVSNSLIVSATPRYFDEVQRLVEQLDQRPPMVMIQVIIAQVRLRETDEFGVELGLQDSLLFDRSLIGDLLTTQSSTAISTAEGVVTTTQDVIQSATNSPGFLFNTPTVGNSGSDRALARSNKVGGQSLSNFAVMRTNNELGFGGLVLSAGSESVSVLLRALQEANRVEVLSRPQIMTLDNQPAYFQVGEEVPLVTGTQVNQFGQNNSVEYEPVGLILTVVPRISPDGLVVMEISAVKSDVGPESEGIPISVLNNGAILRSPRINKIQAETVVSAVSGQTVVLGGLITKEKIATHRGVPWLSDVPVLGNLFRYDFGQIRRSELLIIMTPRIVRSIEDAEVVKQVEAERMHWCLADVIDLHGPVGLRGRYDDWADEETTTVYPGTEWKVLEDGPEETLPEPRRDAPPEPGAGADDPGALRLREEQPSVPAGFMGRIFKRRSAHKDSEVLPAAYGAPAGTPPGSGLVARLPPVPVAEP